MIISVFSLILVISLNSFPAVEKPTHGLGEWEVYSEVYPCVASAQKAAGCKITALSVTLLLLVMLSEAVLFLMSFFHRM